MTFDELCYGVTATEEERLCMAAFLIVYRGLRRRAAEGKEGR